MKSSAEVVDLNENIFGRTIFPLSFVFIALTFSELRGESAPPPPVPQDQKKPGLNRVNHANNLHENNYTALLYVILSGTIYICRY